MNPINFSDLNKMWVNNKLADLPNSKSLLLMSFGITDRYSISIFKDLWAKYDTATKAVGRNEKNTKKAETKITGGALSLIDPNCDIEDNVQLLAEIDLPTPIGAAFFTESSELLIGCAFDIKVLKAGKLTRAIQNNLFNGIHAIKINHRSLYVTCSSTDSILEIDPITGEVIWEWIATEHGFNTSPNGELINIKKEVDYSSLGNIGTRHHTTHVNGVEVFDEENILATLFHQDQLILINKLTGKHKVIYDKLTNPHNIHKFKDGYIVSDTRGNRVIIFNSDLEVVKIVEGYFDWVQDAIDFDNNLIIANDNKGRLEIFNEDYELIKQINWDTDSRMISNIYKISAGDAKNAFLNN